ncbi:MAG: hydroxymethylpyrimidine/phosphomethylpyrimidine kinase [Spongiibacteraceae bacterium]|nr:hydroxymethylpyrimidine/phosphomethylpyrimidine kinase [Spongiibacteraceae bacterium]
MPRQKENVLTSSPVVMSITHHDPSGGGGISADIETLSSLGCHCTPIITELSAHDTSDIKDSQITDTGLLIGQVRAVLEDITVDLFKIGDLASLSHVEAVHTILNDYPNIPVLLDPHIHQEDGRHEIVRAIRTLLFSQAEIVIFNTNEAHTLAPGSDTLSACAQEIMEYGCNNILITGAHGASAQVRNHWFSQHGQCQHYDWERQPNSYLGAGSTLSAALSAYLAHKLSLAESVKQAQYYTWQALRKGRRIGMGALIPDRLHWCRK